MLTTASVLRADDTGHGTHEQLGLPPCMWAQNFDAPCMTCGMTTSFTHAADGHLIDSLATQPMGMLLAVGAACVFWLGLFVAATGSTLGERALRLLSTRALIAFGILGGAAWLYKIAVWHAA